MSAGKPDGSEPEPRYDLAAAVHETTNALTVILGWIDRAREQTTESEVAESLARAARYTRDARRHMRRAIGADEPEPEPEDALAVAARVEEDLAMEARSASVDLAVDAAFADGIRTPIPHPDSAWQILTNIVLNAIAVSPMGGSVTLQCVRNARDVCFHVDDDGPGVPDDEREAIFEGRVQKRKGGAGIGLRHARTMARQLGGELSAHDTPERPGARFTLRWPLARGAMSTRPSDDGPVSVGRPAIDATGLDGARILLLEDDAAVVELLELSLGARGAELRAVDTAEALTAALAEGPFDVVLMDLSPLAPDGAPQEDSRLDGAIADARAANPDIDVVVISGSVTVQPRPDIIWVRKPFEPRELVDTILRHRRQP
ncbi:MAG: ATP-binding protein [Polyangiaceae bacterium]